MKKIILCGALVFASGCKGFETKLDLDPVVNEKLDDVFEVNGVKLVVDRRSLLYLEDVEIDFKDDEKRGFIVNNLVIQGKCGCGSSC